MLNTVIEINCEYFNCGSANFANADEDRTLPDEVLIPDIDAGMKQAHDLTGQRFDASEVRTFALVAGIAGQSKIFRDGAAPMLFRYDVIDFVAGFDRVLWNPAVFAAEAGTPPNQVSKGLLHRL